MFDASDVANWGRIYSEERRRGAPGWSGEATYEHKRRRVKWATDLIGAASGRFLELGCGAGNIVIWMAQRGWEIAGVDVVPEAIDWAMSRAAEADVRADFRIGDIGAMDFADATVDLAFDADCLHMVIQPEHRRRCHAQIGRVLRPGGWFLTGSNLPQENAAAAGYDPDTHVLTTSDDRRYLLLPEAEVLGELRAAGFTVVTTRHAPARGDPALLKAWLDVLARKPVETG